MPKSSDPNQFMRTSGANDSVWVHLEPYSHRPQFPKLEKDIEADVCIIGSGISGISVAEQCVGLCFGTGTIKLTGLAGETGRTSGHLASDLDDGYIAIQKAFGREGAQAAAESHDWAIKHVGDVAEELGIDCEYRMLKAYDVSQYPVGTKEHDEDMKELKEEAELASQLGLDFAHDENLKIKGWDGKPDQRGGNIVGRQATFQPTKYLVGVLNWLKKQPNFECYTHTRALRINESGIHVPLIDLHLGPKHVTVTTVDGHAITCHHAVEATVIPLQMLSVVAELEYHRTYCIAIRIPKGSVEDCLIYDTADPYKYIRMTVCDDKDDYMVVGGCDHKVGQEGEWEERYKELEIWTRERFTHAGSVDYKWSGQIFDPVDHNAFIGKNSGNNRIYVITGDSGNGLTHGVLAGRLITDQIQGIDNPWSKAYDPKRKSSILSKLPSMVEHDVQINTQYKRLAHSDIKDVEDLGLDQGGVLNPTAKGPQAVYKDKNGQIHRMSALCPHLHGVVCWNNDEKSWDCPIHGSRFSPEGLQLCGPAKTALKPFDDSAKARQEISSEP
ncbi:gamma-glutamylputrescine oxidoreductase [Cladophialophora carrionii]|uniref:Gamma-glutamylputrescine oxidoreductase n=1 Tax=Cladophialophora carrionii TaxID=86049 RepID=A0A1C1CTU6_9EURO|nr:gamma-glutamylputrescine oxidoreductase [Cladophialophora carrionii]